MSVTINQLSYLSSLVVSIPAISSVIFQSVIVHSGDFASFSSSAILALPINDSYKCSDKCRCVFVVCCCAGEWLTCGPDQVPCNDFNENMRCIPTDLVCDGEDDCDDSSDEQNCSQYMSSSVAGNEVGRYGTPPSQNLSNDHTIYKK